MQCRLRSASFTACFTNCFVVIKCCSYGCTLCFCLIGPDYLLLCSLPYAPASLLFCSIRAISSGTMFAVMGTVAHILPLVRPFSLNACSASQSILFCISSFYFAHAGSLRFAACTNCVPAIRTILMLRLVQIRLLVLPCLLLCSRFCLFPVIRPDKRLLDSGIR